MIKMRQVSAMVLAFSIAAPSLACSIDGKGGIVPENDLYIPAGMKTLGGITEEEFHKAIDKVEEIYAPIVSSMGAKLQIDRNWSDGTVNAYASQSGKTWKVA